MHFPPALVSSILAFAPTTLAVAASTSAFGTVVGVTNTAVTSCASSTTPSAALACIHAAVIDIGCASRPDMHHCQCENFGALSDVSGACIVDACGQDLALQASSVGTEICSVCEGVFV
ncbi:MAG: hypothetical protein STHCBS139747_000567 [Sporothrix thermara]